MRRHWPEDMIANAVVLWLGMLAAVVALAAVAAVVIATVSRWLGW